MLVTILPPEKPRAVRHQLVIAGNEVEEEVGEVFGAIDDVFAREPGI